jgi:8-hydroxy-5-deazaflavin:NADPH oxidoreductase
MKLAIIGTGHVGQAIARGLQGCGHRITFGARRPDEAGSQAMAQALGAALAPPAQTVQGADAVILALPWGAAQAAVAGLGPMAGQIVVDCMNPLGPQPGGGGLGLVLGHSTSGGEVLQSWLPQARVVKTLNQVGAEIMAEARSLPQRPVMFMAGNDAAAKAQVAALLADLGFEAQDAGDLAKSRLLEPFALLWINQALARGRGRNWAFATTTAATTAAAN